MPVGGLVAINWPYVWIRACVHGALQWTNLHFHLPPSVPEMALTRIKLKINQQMNFCLLTVYGFQYRNVKEAHVCSQRIPCCWVWLEGTTLTVVFFFCNEANSCFLLVWWVSWVVMSMANSEGLVWQTVTWFKPYKANNHTLQRIICLKQYVLLCFIQYTMDFGSVLLL